MDKMTITEALSELNLIKKKVSTKKPQVLANLVRAKNLPDTLASKGGAKAFVSSEVQSVADLCKRFVAIKSAIAKANVTTNVKIGDTEMSVHDWLIWKREISKDDIVFSQSIANTIKTHLDDLARRPQVFKDEKEQPKLVEYEVMFDQAEAMARAEKLQETLDKLDGQLSLKNATVVIEF